MSLVVSVLLVWLGIISYFLFYFSILASGRRYPIPLIDRFLDGSITSSLLIVITSVAWLQRSNRYGHLAFGIIFLITSFWFYYLVTKLNYPSLSLKVEEGDLFPSELLEKMDLTQEDQDDLKESKENKEEKKSKLIFVLPTLASMFILHAVKRVLELQRQEKTAFTWYIILTEEPSETPLISKIQEQASISILQTNDLYSSLSEENSTLKINKPLFFILSPEKKIQWLLNPKSMHDLLLLDTRFRWKELEPAMEVSES